MRTYLPAGYALWLGWLEYGVSWNGQTFGITDSCQRQKIKHDPSAGLGSQRLDKL